MGVVFLVSQGRDQKNNPHGGTDELSKDPIYVRALELLTQCQALTTRLPRGTAYLADQMRRASCSVVLNYAEGSSKPSHAERRRYFDIARASAYELAAALDVARCLGAITAEQHEQTLDACDHVAAMLTRFERR